MGIPEIGRTGIFSPHNNYRHVIRQTLSRQSGSSEASDVGHHTAQRFSVDAGRAPKPASAGLNGKSFRLPISPLPLAAANPKPMVTWRVTRSCNLNCLSCLYDSRPRRYGAELTTAEGMALISDLAAFQVPRLLFAGGEPLLRADLLELVAYAQ